MYLIADNLQTDIYHHWQNQIIHTTEINSNQSANSSQIYEFLNPEIIQQEKMIISEQLLSQINEDNPLINTTEINSGNSLRTEPKTPEEKPFQPQKLPLVLEKKKAKPPSSPGITMLTPSAYGKSWGRASVGVSVQSRARFNDAADGALGFGFGVGDAKNSVGLDINISVVDISSFEDGGISFKLHRQLPADFAVAVGAKNLITFGNTDGGKSGYGVITKMFSLQDSEEKPFSRLYVSAGVGGGQFRSESDIENQIDSLGVFGSVALKVAKPVNAIIEWSGQDLGVGVSVAPFKNFPLVITPGLSDITGNAGDGTRFILGIGYSFSF
ncbi:MAG: hypothetical protein EAZ87_04190 [Nostocales cyanobacterium]|nr:MAG: hypothetical protein EAZ87_04190 [Nostocales cyanobacterium]